MAVIYGFQSESFEIYGVLGGTGVIFLILYGLSLSLSAMLYDTTPKKNKHLSIVYVLQTPKYKYSSRVVI